MSGILGVFGERAAAPEAVRQRMLAGVHERGRDLVCWRQLSERGALAATRAEWETGPEFGGPLLVAEDPPLAVAADASLFYRDDLRRAIGAQREATGGDWPGRLILAAYRRWGEGCPARLEGDFAFVLYDTAGERVLAARDFGGKRPLFYAEFVGTLAVASTIDALLAHPGCPRELNLSAIAADAAGLFAVPDETPFRSIHRLPAGYTLSWRPGGRVQIGRHWTPPPIRPGRRRRGDFDAAAEELRELLRAAVAERMAPSGTTAVWMSGGYDSTAVFGIAHSIARRGSTGRQVRPVSIHYPFGDPGHEDDLIGEIASFSGVPVRWVDSTSVPMFDRPREAAAERDEPFVHPYQRLNQALALASRDAGARIALGGLGGDPLFQLSDAYLADLLWRGRWLALRRQWKRRTHRGPRAFLDSAVLPIIPPRVLALLGRLRGRPLAAPLERRAPDYMDRNFLRRHRLVERERASTPRRGTRSPAAYEMLWYLEYPFFPRVVSALYSAAFGAGVELRSPLYDGRVVAFAASRPLEERAWSGEKKRLLRAAVRGLLPDRILAPRPWKTGTSEGYFDRWIRHFHDTESEGLFRQPLLGELGIVDAGRLRDAWRRYFQSGSGELAGPLYFTLETELWLRGRQGRFNDGPG